MTDDQDDDAPPTVDLVAEIFTHVLRMAGRHGIAIDEAQIDPVVKAMLAEEDRSALEGDFTQAIEKMFELPECLGAYGDQPEIERRHPQGGRLQIESVADFRRSRWPASSRNGWPTSNQNGWSTSVGIRTKW
jgi:hypothetical protein